MPSKLAKKVLYKNFKKRIVHVMTSSNLACEKPKTPEDILKIVNTLNTNMKRLTETDTKTDNESELKVSSPEEKENQMKRAQLYYDVFKSVMEDTEKELYEDRTPDYYNWGINITDLNTDVNHMVLLANHFKKHDNQYHKNLSKTGVPPLFRPLVLETMDENHFFKKFEEMAINEYKKGFNKRYDFGLVLVKNPVDDSINDNSINDDGHKLKRRRKSD